MTNSVGTKVALTAMIATIHHMGLAWDFLRIDPHREDWLRWQGQTWKVTRVQAGFPEDATRRRRLFWVAGPDRWNTRRGKDCLRRDLHGEDCPPGQQIYAIPVMEVAKSQFEAFAFTGGPKGYSVRGPLYAALIELIVGNILVWFRLGWLLPRGELTLLRSVIRPQLRHTRWSPLGDTLRIPSLQWSHLSPVF